MEQRYDVVLYNKSVTIDGRQIDGAVFVAPHCRIWKSYSKLFDRFSNSAIELKKEYCSLSDVIYHVVRSSKDPSKVIFLTSPSSEGSFKDFLDNFKHVHCLYVDGQFVGIFMQGCMFNV